MPDIFNDEFETRCLAIIMEIGFEPQQNDHDKPWISAERVRWHRQFQMINNRIEAATGRKVPIDLFRGYQMWRQVEQQSRDAGVKL